MGFNQLDKDFTHPEMERKTLEIWEQEDTFKKILDERSDGPSFVFYEGPPTANGKPGIHHVMARTVKDAVCRYKTMKGFYTPRKAGWDTHGLPVEIEVQKNLGLEGKSEIIDHGIEDFNKSCRESVFTYKEQWDRMTKNMGYWIDLEDPYITLDNNYIESIWWILNQFHEADLIYKGHRVVPYCPKCETPLSSHELAQGYKECKDPSAYVIVKGIDSEYDFMIWTTTPWTLPSNVAIAVGSDIDYVIVKIEDRERPFVVAKDRLEVIESEKEILGELKGSDLLGKGYEPMFSELKPDGKAHYIIAGDFVTTDSGSGLVHLAPAFGEDDYQVCRKEGLPMLNPINASGCFDSSFPELEGKFVKDADPDIITMLKRAGKLFRSQKLTHDYPFCWRCDKPLIYYAREAWYIEVTKIKDKLIESNNRVNWFPETIGTGRFGSWLENLQDWSLSRDRFWGTPLNIWICDKCDEQECISSIQDLKDKSGVEGDVELHKPHVDKITFKCSKCDGTMHRTPEVIDCWFDSGAMPFAQWHYPFENKEHFDSVFPADFICEAIDQTRGWFYSLLAIAVFLKGESSYKNVVVCELILDKDGSKMSKSRGNSVDPFQMLDTYGADILRWYLMTTTSVWQPTRFDEEGVKAVKRKFFDTLVNTYRFFVMYANVDEFDNACERIPVEDRPLFDRWLISRMNSLMHQCDREMDRYDFTKAMNLLSDFFVEEVSNWYVRLNRRRFWKEGESQDKISAYCTLQEVMLAVCRLMAPVAPFLSDHLHRELGSIGVHECDIPEAQSELTDEAIERSMETTRKIVEIGRNLRTQHNLKVRQALREVLVQSNEEVYQDIILSELNVKEYTTLDGESDMVKKKAKPQFKKLGPVFGKKVPQVANRLKSLSADEITAIEKDGQVEIDLEGEKITVSSEFIDIEIDQLEGFVAAGDGKVLVTLKTELDDELIADGWAREFINRLQNMRKDVGLEITDRISLQAQGDQELINAITVHKELIDYELLSNLAVVDSQEDLKLEHQQEISIDDKSLKVALAVETTS